MNQFENKFKRAPTEQEQRAINKVVEEVFNLHINSTKKKQSSGRYTGEIILERHQELPEVSARINEVKDIERETKSDITILAMEFFAKNNRVPDSIDLWNSFKNYQEEEKAA